MSNASAPRRLRVARNIYRRPNGVLEVGYRDSAGTQRWRTVDGGIMAARAVRDDVLGRKCRGERVQPNPKLRFGEAADHWLSEQISDLRPTTQASYRNAVETHLRPRWDRRRLDTMTVDDVAALVRDMRGHGKGEWTIVAALKAANRIFKFARRRLAWVGENPVSDLEQGERPKVSASARRRVYQGGELAETLAAAREPYRTLFPLAAVTGARLSELLGLVWQDVDLSDTDAAEIRIEWQVDRRGKRQPLKTEESRRVVEIPRAMAVILARHKLAAADTHPDAFVFASRSGRALGQRNVERALRRTQRKAVDQHGHPTFPCLQDKDERGRPKPVAKGAVPTFHGFRHTAVSLALSAGESAEEISWQLGHKNSVVTRTVYAQEIKSVERKARRRLAMQARYESALEAADGNGTQSPGAASVTELPRRVGTVRDGGAGR